MQKDAAIQLLNNTFNNSFDQKRYSYLIKNLFKNIKEAPFTYRGNTIPKAYQDQIRTLSRVGKFKDADGNLIDILYVQLEKETSLERARTMQRNLIAWYLNGSRGDMLKDAAIVAFTSPNQGDWRFSLVKMDYELKLQDSGKVKVGRELTPARRWSFLVGSNENTHTARKQLLPLLTTEEELTLKDLEKAFDIEVVTKEFFGKYRELYQRTKDALDAIASENKTVRKDFEQKGVDTDDFAKKLLGQIVFLYFLQKKGWFGVERDAEWGIGPKNFLRQLFEGKLAEYDNFFNRILEPLFYEALAVERTDDYYSQFNCKIPFLNGGLFDPIFNYDWIHTDINLPNELFSNSEKTKEGDKGTGILDVFDRYNFTVKEDEPLEKEVAIDPEMLGKVFENLLEVKDRKSKGTYYTPREIVHYMCQESLINYLTTELTMQASGNVRNLIEDIRTLIQYGETFVENEEQVQKQGKETETYSHQIPAIIRQNANFIDEKLANIKVCDPAVGSGAFPVGMMKEIVGARRALTPYVNNGDRSTYQFKRHAIQNSLYGVDIDPGAVEIAKLRLWLSLIVDEESRHTIRALPNLDYKIMQGNSLIELISYTKTHDQKRTELVSDLEKLKGELFDSASTRAKNQKREKIDTLSKALFEYDRNRKITSLEQKIRAIKSQGKLFEDEKSKREDAKRVDEWQAEIKKVKKLKIPGPTDHFEWHIVFSEVFQQKGGFDVVIANPPYVKEYVNRAAFDGLRDLEYYQGKMDLWYMFACIGIDALKCNGVLTFIAQNNWVTSYGASKMRNKVIQDTQILTLIDFGSFRIFDAGIQTMVMLFKKNFDLKKYMIDYRRLRGDDLEIDNVVALLNRSATSKAEYLNPRIQRGQFVDKPLIFNAPETQSILDKISDRSNFSLDPKKEVAQGIVPNPDIIGTSNLKRIPKHKRTKCDIKNGDGVFVLPKGFLKKLNNYEKRLLKPLYEPSDLARYFIKKVPDKEIIYSTKSDDKKRMPNLLWHLKKFREIMDDRRENKNGRIDYYHLHWPREESYFISGPKILAIRKCAKPSFTYTEKSAYVMMAMNVIRTKRLSLKYLVGVLNSRLIEFWLKHKGKMQGTNFQIDKEPLINLPLVKPNPEIQKQFINLVNKILAVTKDDDYLENSTKQAKVKRYEQQIDQMIYKLYGLTAEEIEIIERT